MDSECIHLKNTLALLQWDQETYLPEKGVAERAEQLALMERLVHERVTSDELNRLLTELGSTTENPGGDEKLSSLDSDFVKILRRNYDRAVKLPADFVSDSARAEGLSQAAWVKARSDNNFEYFLPHLVKMMEIARQKAAYWGFKDNPYDGLLDIYEPGLGEEKIYSLFNPLRERLSALLKKIAACPRPDTSFLDTDYDVKSQAEYCAKLMKHIGFDTARGRIDISAHPFCTSIGSNDIRMTTRYFPNLLSSSIFATIHESGHGIYEMGFPEELQGTVLAGGASMGIHESQSRLWENVIGRSRPFWQNQFPLIQSQFPDKLSKINFDEFYRAINLVEPSLIRVEADEVSYSLHIILRFELEKALFSGTIDPVKLPEVWREKMKEYLGIEPETDSLGVLQDIHWSMGAFGYFPSYALGNLYGLLFWEKLNSEIPSLENEISGGNFSSIHSWLKDKIYVWGQRQYPGDLLKTVTGNTLSVEPFLNYVESKYSALYGI